MVIAPFKWVDTIKRELEAGAWKVITEGRESAPWASFSPAARSRKACWTRSRAPSSADNLLFEAPSRASRPGSSRSSAANVNLGNIPPEEVISVETLRLGVRGDTLLTSTEQRAPERRPAADRQGVTAVPRCTWCATARPTGTASQPLPGLGRHRPQRDGTRAGPRARPRARGQGHRVVVTSHLRRARETAELIRDELAAAEPRCLWRGSAARRDAARRVGGAAFTEIMRRSRCDLASVPRDPETFRFPGGESLADQQRRVLAAVRDGPTTAAPRCS